MQTFPWFDQVPENLKTRNQLAELGLRPGGPVVAQVVWKRGERWANLYDVAAAKLKQPATPAQLAALEKAQLKRRLCPRCGKDTGEVVWRRFRPGRDCPHCVEVRRGRLRAGVAATARTWLRSPRTVILDAETTDLGGYLVQIAVIRAIDGAVLFDTLINPLCPISDEAQQIHGISNEQVVEAPTFEQIADHLLSLLAGHRVVTYNASFDSSILQNELARLAGPWGTRYADGAVRAILRRVRWRCAMELYAKWVGEWSSYHGSCRWQPLPGGDHSALGDVRACLQVLRRMAEAKDGEECPE